MNNTGTSEYGANSCCCIENERVLNSYSTVASILKILVSNLVEQLE